MFNSEKGTNRFFLENISGEKAEEKKENNPEDEKIRFLIESLPLFHTSSLGNKVDLILTCKGLKLATEIILGKLWEEGDDPLTFTEEEIILAKRKIEEIGLSVLELPKEDGVIEGVIEGREKGETEFSVKYRYKQRWLYVAQDEEIAKKLRKAYEEKDDKTLGELFGYPESAVRAYLETGEKSFTLINVEELPEEVKSQDFMAFAHFGFKLSRENWREEIKTAKKWADVVRETDSEVYKEMVMTYREG
jgi:hypothetical protein